MCHYKQHITWSCCACLCSLPAAVLGMGGVSSSLPCMSLAGLAVPALIIQTYSCIRFRNSAGRLFAAAVKGRFPVPLKLKPRITRREQHWASGPNACTLLLCSVGTAWKPTRNPSTAFRTILGAPGLWGAWSMILFHQHKTYYGGIALETFYPTTGTCTTQNGRLAAIDSNRYEHSYERCNAGYILVASSCSLLL